jgi:hypothetical protein
MDQYQQLTCHINRVVSDDRLRPVHISFFLALCNKWITNRFESVYHTSRSQLMRASHIRSKATYHKVLKDLEDFGYVQYHPSYHPIHGSSVRMMIPKGIESFKNPLN